MPTKTFNVAEEYLFKNWQQACRLEKSLKTIRGKYADICGRVCETLVEEHPELDLCRTRVTQNWCDGFIDIGREEWQLSKNCKACISVENLRLELLLDGNAEHPFIGIWAGTSKQPALDIEEIKRVQAAADTVLAKDELAICVKDDPAECYYIFWYELPEKRADLVECFWTAMVSGLQIV